MGKDSRGAYNVDIKLGLFNRLEHKINDVDAIFNGDIISKEGCIRKRRLDSSRAGLAIEVFGGNVLDTFDSFKQGCCFTSYPE